MCLTRKIKITKLLQKIGFHDQNLNYTFKKDNYPFKEFEPWLYFNFIELVWSQFNLKLHKSFHFVQMILKEQYFDFKNQLNIVLSKNCYPFVQLPWINECTSSFCISLLNHDQGIFLHSYLLTNLGVF